MDWDNLQIFLIVARHGTLARAARVLKVDATTVSRRVGSLESALQQTLFERAPGGFVLTAAGRALVPHAEAMAAAAARIHAADGGGALEHQDIETARGEKERSRKATHAPPDDRHPFAAPPPRLSIASD